MHLRKIALIGFLSIFAIFLVGLTTTELFPPFQWSRPAADVLRSSEEIQKAINSTLEQNRDSTEILKKIIGNDAGACQSKPNRSEKENLIACLNTAVARMETQNASLETSLIATRSSLSKDSKILSNASSASNGFAFSSFDQTKRFLKWIGPTGLVTILGAVLLAIALTQSKLLARADGKAPR